MKPSLGDVMRGGADIALGYAKAGVHEEGGNNQGSYVQFFQHVAGTSPGEPWCAAFVYTCLVKAYAQLSALPEDRTSLLALVPQFAQAYTLPRTAYCPNLWKAFKALGLTHGKEASVAAGAIVFYDFQGVGAAHHVGFVTSASAGIQPLSTVEANTSSGIAGSQADGDGVFDRRRSRTSVFGFATA